MTDISPGDVVTITGTVTELIGEYGFEMLLPDGVTYITQWMRPDVQVTVLAPERETVEDVFFDHIARETTSLTVRCRCGKSMFWDEHLKHLAQVLRDEGLLR